MGTYLNPGNSMFRQALNSEIYVDKTGIIEYTNQCFNTRQNYICVSRPRRFGKSMAAEMLSAYYSKGADSQELFKGLYAESAVDYEKHLNKSNVLFFNMQNFLSKSSSVAEMVGYLTRRIMRELIREFGEYIAPEDENNLSDALLDINSATDAGFVFIIDEWDCIFREKRNAKAEQEKYLDFLRDLLKDKPYVDLAYMTGILPIKKYGTQSALNMFQEISMTDPGKFARFMGFTEDEVKSLCENYHMDFDNAKNWYDGYYLKNAGHVYNPKSVVDAMLNKEYQNYWTRTETYETLKIYIDMDFDGLKNSIISMIGGGYCVIDTKSFSNDMTSLGCADDVMTLLIHLGYLGYDSEKQAVFIPNEEIRQEFLTAISRSGWGEVMQALNNSEELLEATLNGDSDIVARGIEQVHLDTTSILNYNNENALSCVISIAYYSARRKYMLVRELPTGKGFADIVFIPQKHINEPAIVVELKWDKSAYGAIQQINEKMYCNALRHYTGSVILVGINYDKDTKHHECIIESKKMSKAFD